MANGNLRGAPAVALAADGTAAVAFVRDGDADPDTADHDVALALRTAGTWGAPVDVAADPTLNEADPVAALGADGLRIAWTSLGPEGADVLSLLHGVDPAPAVVARTPTTDLQLTTMAGAPALAWADGTGVRLSTLGSEGWSIPRALGLPEGAWAPAVAGDATGVDVLALTPLPSSVVAHAREQALPDLRVDELVADEGVIVANVTNAGTAAAPASTLAFTDNGDPIETVELPALAQGQTTTVTIAWIPPADGVLHQVAADADPAGVLSESDEGNNRASVDAALPDLSLDVLQATTDANGLHVQARVVNAGASPAPASSVVLQLDDGTPLASAPTPALQAGAEAAVTLEAPLGALPSGARALPVVVDPARAAPDADRTNNVGAAASLRAPDLRFASSIPAPAGAVAGQTVILDAVVENAGLAASNATNVTLQLAGETVATTVLPSLAPGESTQIALPWAATGGFHTLVLAIEPDADLGDAHRGDDSASVDVFVRGHADLVPVGVDYTTAGAIVTVENAGADLSWDTEVALASGSGTLATGALAPIAPGGRVSVVLPFTWPLASPAESLTITADPEDVVGEADESNNVLTLPALRVASATHESGIASTSADVEVGWTLPPETDLDALAGYSFHVGAGEPDASVDTTATSHAFVAPPDATTPFGVRAVLLDGSTGPVARFLVVVSTRDTAPPTTRLVVLGPAVPGPSGLWIGRDTALALEASDDPRAGEGASGLNATYAALDAEAETAAPATFRPFDETHRTGDLRVVAYWSDDAAGNQEPVRRDVLALDAAAPLLALDGVDAPGTPRVEPGLVVLHEAAPATFHFAASDEQSGIASVALRFDGADVALGGDRMSWTWTSPVAGRHTLQAVATDAAGNVQTLGFDVVLSTRPPTIDAADDVVVEATQSDGATVGYTPPTTRDEVDGDGAASCDPPPGSVFPLGSTAVTCTAVNSVGQEAAPVTFHVHVVDTTPPAIAPVDDIRAEATGPDGANVTFEPPATTDAVDGPGVATCDATPGATFPLGETPVRCAATDAHGNEANTTFIVAVVDTTPPSVDDVQDLTVEAAGPDGAEVTFPIPATRDAVDGAGVADCDAVPGAVFPLGVTSVTCQATDAAGNAAEPVAFDVLVRDTTAPAIAPADDIEVDASGLDGAIVAFAAPTWTDAVDGNGTTTCSPASGALFPLGQTNVTCSVTDAAGNAADTTFAVDVVLRLLANLTMERELYAPDAALLDGVRGVYHLETGDGTPVANASLRIHVVRRAPLVGFADSMDVSGVTNEAGRFAFEVSEAFEIASDYTVFAFVDTPGLEAAGAHTEYAVGVRPPPPVPR